MADRMQQVRLAESRLAPDEQRVVRAGRSLGDRERGGAGEAVRVALDERREGVAAVEVWGGDGGEGLVAFAAAQEAFGRELFLGDPLRSDPGRGVGAASEGLVPIAVLVAAAGGPVPITAVPAVEVSSVVLAVNGVVTIGGAVTVGGVVAVAAVVSVARLVPVSPVAVARAARVGPLAVASGVVVAGVGAARVAVSRIAAPRRAAAIVTALVARDAEAGVDLDGEVHGLPELRAERAGDGPAQDALDVVPRDRRRRGEHREAVGEGDGLHEAEPGPLLTAQSGMIVVRAIGVGEVVEDGTPDLIEIGRHADGSPLVVVGRTGSPGRSRHLIHRATRPSTWFSTVVSTGVDRFTPGHAGRGREVGRRCGGMGAGAPRRRRRRDPRTPRCGARAAWTGGHLRGVRPPRCSVGRR